MVEPNILIAQVEPPQNEEGGDYYYRTLLPGKGDGGSGRGLRR